MTPLIEIEHDVRESQMYRKALLAQPPEFFQRIHGFIPNMIQKIYLVEQTIQSTMSSRTFANEIYRVKVRKYPPIVHLDLARHDGQPITSWRELQQIKNELVGPECEGVELFPAESRLVDTSHQYHIWVIEDTQFRFPFGYKKRIVLPHAISCPDEVDEMLSLDGSAWPLNSAVSHSS